MSAYQRMTARVYQHRPPTITDEDKALMRALYRPTDGGKALTIAEIADKFGVSIRYVRRVTNT